MNRLLTVLAFAVVASLLTSPHANAGCQDVKTVSGKVFCLVRNEQVVCYSNGGFQGSPSGNSDYLAAVDSGGSFHWIYAGGLGSCGTTPLELAYGSNQSLNGWNIQATENGTTYINQNSGRGMFVSIQSTHGV